MLQTTGIDSNIGRGDNGTGSILNRITNMEKGLKIWHAVLATISILITGGTILVNQSNKIETQQLRIQMLETNQRDANLTLKEINGKLTDILVKLENKENKK
jgi:hypothetical protein